MAPRVGCTLRGRAQRQQFIGRAPRYAACIPELFRDDTISLAHHDGEAWLHVDWPGDQTVGSVKAGCERILALMVERAVGAVLNDNTHVVGIWSGASE